MHLAGLALATAMVSFLGDNPFGYGAFDQATIIPEIGLYGASEFWPWVNSKLRELLA